jgi:multiple sugar transport system substrate-binding protein
MLKMLGVLGGGAFLAGCGPAVPAAPATTEKAPAEAPAEQAAAPAEPATTGPTGTFTYWQTPAEVPVDIANLDSFWDYMKAAYPGVDAQAEYIGYGDMLDKLRVAVRGGGGPHVAVLPILWGVEFAANGFLKPLAPEDLGYKEDQFWPKAIASCQWEGKTYGIPTNNETMAFIYNKRLFEKAGLDPDKPPETWEEVVEFSKKINMDLDISGFGMVARLNHGNTPFRFMPVLWAYGGSALDEAEEKPTYKDIKINTPESHAALQVYYDMYVRDKSVPRASLDNTQTENRELFLSEQVAMMISHPVEYNVIADTRPEMVPDVQYVLYPKGPVRRAAVFGGSNIHIFSHIPDEAMGAALEFIKTRTNPEWANRLAWFSNPGNREGFNDPYFELRKQQIKFLEVSTEMLQHGIAFPVVPEATEIMNVIVPTMLHNALTETMSVEQAAAEAEKQIQEVLERA